MRIRCKTFDIFSGRTTIANGNLVTINWSIVFSFSQDCHCSCRLPSTTYSNGGGYACSAPLKNRTFEVLKSLVSQLGGREGNLYEIFSALHEYFPTDDNGSETEFEKIKSDFESKFFGGYPSDILPDNPTKWRAEIDFLKRLVDDQNRFNQYFALKKSYIRLKTEDALKVPADRRSLQDLIQILNASQDDPENLAKINQALSNMKGTSTVYPTF